MNTNDDGVRPAAAHPHWWTHHRRESWGADVLDVDVDGPVGYQPVEFLDLPPMGAHQDDPPPPRPASLPEGQSVSDRL